MSLSWPVPAARDASTNQMQRPPPNCESVPVYWQRVAFIFVCETLRLAERRLRLHRVSLCSLRWYSHQLNRGIAGNPHIFGEIFLVTLVLSVAGFHSSSYYIVIMHKRLLRFNCKSESCIVRCFMAYSASFVPWCFGIFSRFSWHLMQFSEVVALWMKGRRKSELVIKSSFNDATIYCSILFQLSFSFSFSLHLSCFFCWRRCWKFANCS